MSGTRRPRPNDGLAERVAEVRADVRAHGELLGEIRSAVARLEGTLQPADGSGPLPVQVALLDQRVEALEQTATKAWQVRVAIIVALLGLGWQAVSSVLAAAAPAK